MATLISSFQHDQLRWIRHRQHWSRGCGTSAVRIWLTSWSSHRANVLRRFSLRVSSIAYRGGCLIYEYWRISSSPLLVAEYRLSWLVLSTGVMHPCRKRSWERPTHRSLDCGVSFKGTVPGCQLSTHTFCAIFSCCTDSSFAGLAPAASAQAVNTGSYLHNNVVGTPPTPALSQPPPHSATIAAHPLMKQILTKNAQASMPVVNGVNGVVR